MTETNKTSLAGLLYIRSGEPPKDKRIKAMILAILREDTSKAYTAGELAKAVNLWRTQHGMKECQIDSIRPRFAELYRAGLITISQDRRCGITGQLAVTWQARETPVAAMKTDRKESLRHQVETLKQENAALRIELAAATAKLARWGRPTNEERERKAIKANPSANATIPLHLFPTT